MPNQPSSVYLSEKDAEYRTLRHIIENTFIELSIRNDMWYDTVGSYNLQLIKVPETGHISFILQGLKGTVYEEAIVATAVSISELCDEETMYQLMPQIVTDYLLEIEKKIDMEGEEWKVATSD